MGPASFQRWKRPDMLTTRRGSLMMAHGSFRNNSNDTLFASKFSMKFYILSSPYPQSEIETSSRLSIALRASTISDGS